jgi:NAD(P)-dependent dehydrogenase (short-subunit alcohol dehydrogenase family)
MSGLAGAWLYQNSRRREDDFHGKVVLITGGSRGLGLALAFELAAQGCRLALAARDPKRLAEAAADPRFEASEVVTFPCDVSDEEQVKQLIDDVTRRFGRLDILVNNAGVIQVGPAEDMTIDDYREATDVMFWGPLYAILAALPHFREQGGGSIVNIASIGGRVAVPHLAPYCAAKFALVGLSRAFSTEFRRLGIYVLTVNPGLMRTGSHLNAQFRGKQGLELTWFGLSGTAPGLSLAPAKAAAQIVDAMRRRQSEIVLSAPAKLLTGAQAMAPGAVAAALCAANRALPKPAGRPTEKLTGRAVIERDGGLGARAVELAGRTGAARYQ